MRTMSHSWGQSAVRGFLRGWRYCLGGHRRNPANPTEQGLDPLFRVKIFNIPQCGAASGRERGREGREERATVFACVNRLWELNTSVWRGGGEAKEGYCTTVQRNSLRQKRWPWGCFLSMVVMWCSGDAVSAAQRRRRPSTPQRSGIVSGCSADTGRQVAERPPLGVQGVGWR